MGEFLRLHFQFILKASAIASIIHIVHHNSVYLLPKTENFEYFFPLRI